MESATTAKPLRPTAATCGLKSLIPAAKVLRHSATWGTATGPCPSANRTPRSVLAMTPTPARPSPRTWPGTATSPSVTPVSGSSATHLVLAADEEGIAGECLAVDARAGNAPELLHRLLAGDLERIRLAVAQRVKAFSVEENSLPAEDAVTDLAAPARQFQFIRELLDRTRARPLLFACPQRQGGDAVRAMRHALAQTHRLVGLPGDRGDENVIVRQRGPGAAAVGRIGPEMQELAGLRIERGRRTTSRGHDKRLLAEEQISLRRWPAERYRRSVWVFDVVVAARVVAPDRPARCRFQGMQIHAFAWPHAGCHVDHAFVNQQRRCDTANARSCGRWRASDDRPARPGNAKVPCRWMFPRNKHGHHRTRNSICRRRCAARIVRVPPVVKDHASSPLSAFKARTVSSAEEPKKTRPAAAMGWKQ